MDIRRDEQKNPALNRSLEGEFKTGIFGLTTIMFWPNTLIPARE